MGNRDAVTSCCAEETSKTLFQDFDIVLDVCTKALQSGNKIMFCGNGGSAADAQHLATELAVRFTDDRPAIAAMSLTTDTST